MDSTSYVVFLSVALSLMCWAAVHFLTRHAASDDPMKSAHTRHLSDDTH
jgi:hypothetical protein